LITDHYLGFPFRTDIGGIKRIPEKFCCGLWQKRTDSRQAVFGQKWVCGPIGFEIGASGVGILNVSRSEIVGFDKFVFDDVALRFGLDVGGVDVILSGDCSGDL
jgi:hypothetical protein